MSLLKSLKAALGVVGLLWPAIGHTQNQAVWQFASDPGFGIGSADVLAGGVPQFAIRCRGSAVPVSPNSYVTADPRVGVATLLMPPTLFPAGQAADQAAAVTLSVDNNFSMRFPAVLGRPEGAYAARVLLNGPLLARMQSGQTVTLSVAGGQSISIGLGGSSQALGQLRQFCIPSVAQQALIPQPGFACARARTGVEVTICSFPDLADADRRMAQTYATARQQGRVNPAEHTAWIANREQCGADVACILQRTNERIAVLSGGSAQIASGGVTSQPLIVPQAQSGALAGQGTAQPANPLQLQSAAPAAAPNAPPVVGQRAVANALLVWLLGQRPTLLSNEQHLNQFRSVQFPPTAPRLEPRAWSDRTSRIAWGQQMAAFVRTQPFPQNVIVDLPANMYRPQEGQPFILQLTGQSTQDTLIREVPLAIMSNAKAFRFLATNPYALELPDAIKQGAGAEQSNDPRQYAPNSEILLRLHLTLQVPEVTLPIDVQNLGYTGGQSMANGQMTIRQIELVKKPRRTQQGQPEQLFLIHRWTPPAELPPISTDPLDSLEKVVSFYGGAVQDGRMIRFSSNVARELGLTLPEGSFKGANQNNGTSAEAEFALRLGTVLEGATDRQMSYDLTQQAAFTMLNVIERDQVLPPGFTNQSRGGSLNELERAQALRGAEPKVREIVKARMPATPLKVSAILLGYLGEYDLGLQGFPLQLDVNQARWLPGLNLQQTLPDRRPPDFVPVPEGDALTLLQQLDVDNLSGRSLPVRVDYTIAGASTLSQRSTQITQEELRLVNIGYAVERIVVFSDASFSKVLLDVPYPEAEERLAAFQRHTEQLAAPTEDLEPGSPEAVFAELRNATTERILAPFVARGQTRYVEGLVSNYEAIRTASPGARPGLIAQEVRRISGLAQDAYWMLLVGAPSYNGALESMVLDQMQFQPLVTDASRLGRSYIPRVTLAPGFRDARVEMSETEYRALSQKLREGRVLAAKMPVNVAGDSQLSAGRPFMLAVLPQGAAQGQVVFPELVVQLEAPEPIGERPVGEVAPPEALYLDHEGVDLLALAQDAALYGDAGYERMMIERAARERQARNDGRAPDWGTFFEDPFLPLDIPTRQSLLPRFKEWTAKRLAALPQTLIVPIAGRNGTHPHTACNDVFELQAGALAGRAISEGYESLLGDEAAALRAAYGSQQRAQQPLPGNDRVFALAARPVLTGGSQQPHCAYLTERQLRNAPALLEGFNVSASPYVDAVFIARGVPHPGNLQRQVIGADYTLSRADVTFETLPRGTGDGNGFKGVLKIDGQVIEAAYWASGQNRVPEIMTTLTEDDWNAALGEKLDAAKLDIVGLTLGMTEAEFLEKVDARMAGGIGFATLPTVRPNIFTHAVGRVDPVKGEVIAAITAEASEGKPVLGIVRARDFAPGAATIPALVDLLQEKYGTPNWTDRNGQYLAWGVPSNELDRFGLCGGRGLIGQGGQPPQIAFEQDVTQAQSRTLQPGLLRYYGWPQAEIDPTAAGSLAYCGPSVTVRIDEVGQGGLRLITWLFDRSASVTLAEEAEQAAKEAKPDLDL